MMHLFNLVQHNKKEMLYTNVCLMNHVKIIICILLITLLGQKGYPHINQTDSTVTDYDGNVYPIVRIGNQIWMAENLRVTHYADGTPIEDGTGIGDIEPVWSSGIEDTTKRYFYYNDNPLNANDYGCLYSWYAAVRGIKGNNKNPSGIQGISPSGWHLPSDKEWTELELSLGMSPSDTSIWWDRGTNQAEQLKPGGNSGFNITFGGARDYKGFSQKDRQGVYISTRTGDGNFCRLFVIRTFSSFTHRWGHNKSCGYSIRCVKDDEGTSINNFLESNSLRKFSLYQNYPNPFNPSTTITYDLQKPCSVTLKIYNLAGQELETLVNGYQPAGIHTMSWNAKDDTDRQISSGVYLLRIQAGNFNQTVKMLYVK